MRAGLPESSVHFYQTKLHHIPEDGKFYNHGCSEPYFRTNRLLRNCAYMKMATRDTRASEKLPLHDGEHDRAAVSLEMKSSTEITIYSLRSLNLILVYLTTPSVT
jgi:hypothetical protein